MGGLYFFEVMMFTCPSQEVLLKIHAIYLKRWKYVHVAFSFSKPQRDNSMTLRFHYEFYNFRYIFFCDWAAVASDTAHS